MKRETISKALNGLDDIFISESAVFSPDSMQGNSERIVRMKKKRIISLALAAALMLLLGIAAYAVFFSMSHRVPDSSETFRIHWEENPNGYIEWSNAKLAVSFPETAESREIEFRPVWLPEKMETLKNGGAWFSRLTAETYAIPGPNFVPEYEDMWPPLLIETYSMSQFNNGGALLLLNYTPDGLIEEHWEGQDVDVLRFHCTQHFDAIPDMNIPERTIEQDIIVMSDSEAGWVVRICGMIGMDQLLEVAKNLEIRETGRVLTYDDFTDHFVMFDGGVG